MSANPQISSEQRLEFRDGTISTLIKWAPDLCPGIETAFEVADGVLRVRSDFIDPEPSEGFRILRNVDTATIRARIEAESLRRFGVKIRTDRTIVRDYIEILADGKRTTGQWLGELPQWDGTERLRTFGELFGVVATPYASKSSQENGRICELAGRVLFMHPCYHAQGVAPQDVPVVLMVGMTPAKLRELMAPIMRGPMREVSQIVTSEQKFAEAFDTSASHILLPDLPQIRATPYRADVGRFSTIVRQSSVHYRPPNLGLSQGIQIIVPGMVGTVPAEAWKVPTIPTIPLTRTDDTAVPDAEIVAQCYAEAMHYVAQGLPIINPRLSTVRTAWGAGE